MAINKYEGNVYPIKKNLFLSLLSGYNINVDDRMSSEKARICLRERGGHAGGPLFLSGSLNSSDESNYYQLEQCSFFQEKIRFHFI